MSRSLPSRRQFLAGGLASMLAASAGCLGLFSEAGDQAETERTLRLSLSHLDGSLLERHVVAADSPPERWADGAVAAALDGESYTTQLRPPFFAESDDPAYVHADGAYYELGSVVVDEVTETHPILRLRLLDDDADAAETVAAAQLPEGDQRAVRVAHMAARARGNVGGYPVGLVQRGGYVFRADDAIAASRLLADDGPDRVSYRDRVHEVAVAREQFHEPVYRATAHRVADSEQRMTAILHARLVDARISRSALSNDAREIVREASTGGAYAESHPYSDGYAALLTAMHKRPYLDGNIEKDARREDYGSGVLRYDGEYYDYALRFVVEDD